MSGGQSCTCEKKDRSKWVVLMRCGNASAFSGYRFTRSSYSQVGCEMCGRIWRTNAKYVRELPDRMVEAFQTAVEENRQSEGVES